MAIYDLRTNAIVNPLGYRMEKPRFTWLHSHPEAKGITSSRLRVSLNEDLSDPLCDTGDREDLPQNGFEPDLELKPRTRYYWNVETVYDNGDRAASDTVYFETAKREEVWEGRWITAPFDKDVHPYFHRNFEVDADLVKARVYVTALGIYELEINGEKVGDEYLAPFYNDYRFANQYQTYDITDYLTEGTNAAGAMLGNGWYKGRFGFGDESKELYGDTLALLAELELTYADGRVERIITDESWQALPGPVQSGNIYDGEVIDYRKDIPGRSTPEADLSGAEDAVQYLYSYLRVKERLSPPVRAIETRTPELIQTPAGETVLDFGQVMTGWVSFEADLPAGKIVRLQHGEILQQGNFFNENLRSALGEYVYISDGEKRTVRPFFTFYGFRYVKVEGIEDVNPELFTGLVIHSDLPETGSIETSHPLVNRLIQNARWGQKGNFLDVPTDCPQRDERMGWTGDAQVFAGTAAFNMHVPAFYKKYLHDMLHSQRGLQGAVPYVVPDALELLVARDAYHSQQWSGSCAWGDAATVIPWTLYLHYGDEYALAEQYENMKLWVGYIESRDKVAGGKKLWTTGFHYADWLALDNPDKNSSFGGTDPYYVASAYYHYSASLTAKAAKVLGKEEDHAYYSRLAEDVKSAMQSEYFDEEGRCKIRTQTAQVLAIWFDLAEGEALELVAADLKELLAANDGHLQTGFVGTAYLCLALSKVGLNEEAYSLLLNEDCPGWLYEVRMGATTVWERWNSVLENGELSDTTMNSLNHYAYGAVVEWIYRVVCGINPSEEGAGFKHAVLKPVPDRRLQYAHAEYRSAHGLYRCGWFYDDEKLIYEITVPVGGSAEFNADITGKFHVNTTLVEHIEGSPGLVLEPGDYRIECKA